MLGPLTCKALPPLLLADVGRCPEAAAVKMLRELQGLAAAPQVPLTAGEAGYQPCQCEFSTHTRGQKRVFCCEGDHCACLVQ